MPTPADTPPPESLHLVQILLPLRDNAGTALAPETFATTRQELTTRFGGLTAYTRAPAEGVWNDAPQAKPPTRDEIVVYEVMTPALDVSWWRHYRAELERRFRQDTVVVRAQHVQVI